MTDEQKEFFYVAKARWESIIKTSIGSYVEMKGSYCNYDFPSTTLIEDIWITAAIKPIDGPGGIAAESGPVGLDFQY